MSDMERPCAQYLWRYVDGIISCRAPRNACRLCGALQQPAPWLVRDLECLQTQGTSQHCLSDCHIPLLLVKHLKALLRCLNRTPMCKIVWTVKPVDTYLGLKAALKEDSAAN